MYKKNNRRTGTGYERKAGAYLESLGYKIVTYNYRCRLGEIDLIAKDGGYLVFVEVKFRSSKGSGVPSEAVDAKKKSRIAVAARYYLLTRGYGEETPCRFDVVAVLEDEVRLIQDAFWL